MLRLLVADDTAARHEWLARLRELPVELRCSATARGVLRELRRPCRFDLLILGGRLAQHDAVELMAAARRALHDAETILIRPGPGAPPDAFDVVEPERLIPSVRNAMRTILLRRETVRLRRLAERVGNAACAGGISDGDSLTGVVDRALFRQRIDEAIAQKRRRAAVLLLGLDRFRHVNESLGLDAGDTLLLRVAERLRLCLDEDDLLARFGGDEFAVLLEDLAHTDEATSLADRLHDALARPFDIDGREVFISASAGIAFVDGDGGGEALLRDANAALSAAKARGKARTIVFDASMRERVTVALGLETDLRHALERGELYVVYQPIVRLFTARICGFEALLRWRSPRRGQVSPEEFIPVAEETGLIGALGDWVLETACTQLAAWRAQIPSAADLYVSVNVSSRQLAGGDLVAQVARLLRANALSPGQLCLEITESSLVDDFDSARRLLSTLQAMGVRLSLDDFGTGYSSLKVIHQLPFDTIKIDRSFVSCVVDRGRHAAIVEAIATMASSLRMDVVAEGVETPEQVQALLKLRCGYGQGFFYSKPLAASACLAELRQRLRPARFGRALSIVEDEARPSLEDLPRLDEDDPSSVPTIPSFALPPRLALS